MKTYVFILDYFSFYIVNFFKCRDKFSFECFFILHDSFLDKLRFMMRIIG